MSTGRFKPLPVDRLLSEVLCVIGTIQNWLVCSEHADPKIVLAASDTAVPRLSVRPKPADASPAE